MVIKMGNVMIALDDEHEALLRKLAQEKYGGKKGSLSEVIKEALDNLDVGTREKARKNFIERLKKGLEFEYKMYKNRSEIYD